MSKSRAGVYLTFTLGLMVMPFFMNAQVTKISDSVSLQAFIIQRGDVVTLVYDSAFVLNKNLYKLYKETYNKSAKMNLVWEELARSYIDLIALQDSMLKSKDIYYHQLKESFDSLAGRTSGFLTKTDGNLSDITRSLDNATSNLDNIKTSINTVVADLKQQKKEKTKFAVGGFVIGLSLASIIFLVTK